MIGPAHALADIGLPVFPLEVGGKRPHGRLAPNGLHDASVEPRSIVEWWCREPEANVAVRTGKGLLVLDCDGDEGADSLASLERDHGVLPDTVRSVTPRGAHYFFSTRQKVPCSVGRVGAGLDVRGDGGYVVVPPSRHPSGALYEWDVPPGEGEIAPAPSWLEGLVTARPVRVTKEAPYWRQIACGVREGQRNDSAARLCGHLLGKGVDPHVTLELLVAWDASRNQPAMGRDEVTRVCESIARRELSKGRRGVSA